MTRDTDSADRPVTQTEEIEITPEMIEAGVEAAREWMRDPDNYLAMEAGGEGDLAALVIAIHKANCRNLPELADQSVPTRDGWPATLRAIAERRQPPHC
jgi:hypothetical protein